MIHLFWRVVAGATSGRSIITSGRSIITSGRSTSGRSIITSGRSIITSGRSIITSGRSIITSGRSIITSGRSFVRSRCFVFCPPAFLSSLLSSPLRSSPERLPLLPTPLLSSSLPRFLSSPLPSSPPPLDASPPPLSNRPSNTPNTPPPKKTPHISSHTHGIPVLINRECPRIVEKPLAPLSCELLNSFTHFISLFVTSDPRVVVAVLTPHDA